MKTFGKILSTTLVSAMLVSSSYAAVEPVSCATNDVFGANACNECFTGGAVSQGENKGLLTDVWNNTSDAGQVLFKEEQDMPKMIALGWATWTEQKASDNVNFWQYTQALDDLYDADSLGYKLDAGKTVTWLESTLGSAYQLTKNTVPEGEWVGLLTYDIAVHQLSADGMPSDDSDTHRECVLYTSGTPGEPPVTPEQPGELPKTGPEHILLGLIAILLAAGVFYFRKKA